jgi:hypothetical protein
MKTLLKTLAVIAAFVAISAQAQFIQAPSRYSAISNASTWTVNASNGATVAVNVPLAQAPWVPIGGQGFAVSIKAFATNAALTTNCWFTLEFTSDGVNAITNNTVTVVYLPTGVATNTYHTNFATSTSALLGNLAAVRIKNVMQTNGVVGSSLAGNLFVEKFTISTR